MAGAQVDVVKYAGVYFFFFLSFTTAFYALVRETDGSDDLPGMAFGDLCLLMVHTPRPADRMLAHFAKPFQL